MKIMDYRGFYINLDRSTERRAQIEGELARFGLSDRYRRFAAADGNVFGFPYSPLSAAEIGCFTSHYLLLCRNLDSPTHLHILEDDAVLSSFTARTVESTIASGMIDQYDLIFTDTFITPLNSDYRDALALFEKAVDRDAGGKIVNIRPTTIRQIAGASSYLVNRRSIERLVNLLESQLRRGARTPLDIFMREAKTQNVIATACLFPFVTGVRFDIATTIPGRDQNQLTQIAAALGRASFFVESDLAALNALAAERLPLPEGDLHRRLLERVLAFSLTGDFREY